jgi:hypothetical protein
LLFFILFSSFHFFLKEKKGTKKGGAKKSGAEKVCKKKL